MTDLSAADAAALAGPVGASGYSRKLCSRGYGRRGLQ
jgi:hypothetical protein